MPSTYLASPLVFAALLASGTTPNAAYGQDADARQAQCMEIVERQFPSREGVRLQRAEMFRECARVAHGMTPLREEYWAHFIYLASEIDAGRMTKQQADYLDMQKQNDIKSRAQAQMLQILPYALQEQQQREAARQRAFKPYTPPPTYNTTCQGDRYGNTNCTTR